MSIKHDPIPVMTMFEEEFLEAILSAVQTPYGERAFKTWEIAKKTNRESTALSPRMYSLERLGAIECVRESNAGYLWRANTEEIEELLERRTL